MSSRTVETTPVGAPDAKPAEANPRDATGPLADLEARLAEAEKARDLAREQQAAAEARAAAANQERIAAESRATVASHKLHRVESELAGVRPEGTKLRFAGATQPLPGREGAAGTTPPPVMTATPPPVAGSTSAPAGARPAKATIPSPLPDFALRPAKPHTPASTVDYEPRPRRSTIPTALPDFAIPPAGPASQTPAPVVVRSAKATIPAAAVGNLGAVPERPMNTPPPVPVPPAGDRIVAIERAAAERVAAVEAAAASRIAFAERVAADATGERERSEILIAELRGQIALLQQAPVQAEKRDTKRDHVVELSLPRVIEKRDTDKDHEVALVFTRPRWALLAALAGAVAALMASIGYWAGSGSVSQVPHDRAEGEPALGAMKTPRRALPSPSPRAIPAAATAETPTAPAGTAAEPLPAAPSPTVRAAASPAAPAVRPPPAPTPVARQTPPAGVGRAASPAPAPASPSTRRTKPESRSGKPASGLIEDL